MDNDYLELITLLCNASPEVIRLFENYLKDILDNQ